MAVTYTWDDDKRLLRYTFEGNWTWEEYFVALENGREEMKQVSHVVCVINDYLGGAPNLPNILPNAKSIIKSRPDNTGLAVFLTDSRFYGAMYRNLKKIMPEVEGRYVLATTEAEAMTLINSWRDKYDIECDTELKNATSDEEIPPSDG